ncbi:arginine--tRNA ligase [Fervidicoccus fontis]|uniref:Arginine--tRNA ligase n=2 Tax=Fervidicoccus fontis TaxID=683846 RepID=H9ZZI3_FERFK|nr:arginine--tRNA ligase [Fervidicoccus fontis]AFH42140.1 arginyl-tRNA synthetase [Fervidicoccus fontis Kam940]MBE9390893.1 arginine--tRNA ligase [Fervidicoccus fontis]
MANLPLSINDKYLYNRILLALRESLDDELGPSSQDRLFLISEPPENVDADLSYPLVREIRQMKRGIEDYTKELSRKLTEASGVKIDATYTSGYLNLKFNRVEFAKKFFEEFFRDLDNYGGGQAVKKLNIVVEHTSANPLHPLHIGHARNSCLGDTISRLLKFYGMNIERRFYIDDMGRQMALLIYGILKLNEDGDWKRFLNEEKIDHRIGEIYAATNILVEINELKKKIKSASEDDYQALIAQQDELVAESARIRDRSPEIFDVLAEKIMKDEDPEKEISQLSLRYEQHDENVVKIFREVIELVIGGFKETLGKLGIEFDKWDYESDLVWSGLVDEILRKARESQVFTIYKGAEALSYETILNDSLKEKLFIPKEMDIPPLILKRSDGTTLYTTRDIAYSIKKFKEFNADYVINVIAKEQTLPQAQLRLALYSLGYREYAERLIHYSYEMVNLPGYKMSGRRGRFVSLDELIEMSENAAKQELLKRKGQVAEDVEQVYKAVGRSAVRYSLVSISSEKPLVLKLNDVINFEKNTAPYVQYTYARAFSLLAKAGSYERPTEFDIIEKDDQTYKLIRSLSKFPWVIHKSTTELKPELIVAYLGDISQKFNSWYDNVPVLGEKDERYRALKIATVNAVKSIIGSALNIVGVVTLEKM